MAYVDCQTDDARLVLENVLDAEASGATVANHLRAETPLRDRRGRVTGVVLADSETGARFEARARVVLSATGPFTDSFLAEPARHRLRPTLGVHLVFDAARVPHNGRALVLRSPRDNRLFFVLPAGARTVVGTTDTDWPSPRAAAASTTTSARAAKTSPTCSRRPITRFPTCAWRRTTCCRPSRPCGRCWRPAPTRPRRPRASTRSRAPPNGLLVIAGGKLTTLRRMGEEAVDRSIEALHAAGLERALDRCVTGDRPLPGGGPPPASLAQAGLPPDVTARLAAAYGGRAELVARLAADVARAGAADRSRAPVPLGRGRPRRSRRARAHASPTCSGGASRFTATRATRDSRPPTASPTILATELAWPAARRARALRRLSHRRRTLPPLARRAAAQRIVMTPSTARSRA